MSCIANYWRIFVPVKSTAELSAEEWLFVVPWGPNDFITSSCVRFTRWRLLVMSIFGHVCVGSFLAFNTLVDGLDVHFYSHHTGDTIQTMLLSFVFFGFSAAFIGPFVENHPPRTSLAVGTSLVATGYFLSQMAVVGRSPIVLTIGFSAFSGTGFGVVLIALTSGVQKWFPDCRGLASGLCMFGLGLGFTGFTLFYTWLLKRIGPYDPVQDITAIPHVFWSSGIGLVGVLAVCAAVVRTPPPTFEVNGQDIHCIPVSRAPRHDVIHDEFLKAGMTLVNFNLLQEPHDAMTDVRYFQQVKAMTLLQCITSLDFACLFIAFAANSIPGMLFASEVYDIAAGVFSQSSSAANHLVLQGFVANSIGRLVCPAISDLLIRVFYTNPAFARKAVFVALLTAQLVAFGFVSDRATMTFESTSVVVIVVVFCSGGGFALLPCFITDMFGVYHTATMCGLALTCWSLRSVVVGYAFHAFQVTPESLGHQFNALLILVAVGWAASLIVRTNTMDRFYVGYQLSLCGKVVVRLGGGGIHLDEGSMSVMETARERVSTVK
ncbi:hypothetical protein H310_12473 [Aphanomyces invadans]|uniref:Major facilitator superfamily (MFS) profile domain-containing protein n=1 Tax=Aphanomyces invadans TaxID=157072 RepID=A0A024TI83_9STRA|nr:hypothetical protein H310_12473 [Aphanomyces invadans]ETV93709.1 hypothetical protein H310_12473 [Aphanomyces invadans]|eukprot:XP_008877750.1 hypothetical protein H310_12473 [Aphanomyces invadans]